MKEIFRKLSSRKLAVAVAGIVTGIALMLGADGEDINTIAGAITSLVSIMTYIITEGKVDAASVKKLTETEEV
jgi:phage shock protein PspC (stress-responsive transcriptional regulator)